jgi:antitoxin component HigA of HigAB toxin-antitoxin module
MPIQGHDQHAGVRAQVGSTSSAQTRECELDTLIESYENRAREEQLRLAREAQKRADPLERLRVQMTEELLPAFKELRDKYARAGFTMQMDVSRILAGERELTIEMCFREHRSELCGIVTRSAIAFTEIHYIGDTGGGIRSGPSIRLRNLNGMTFREFICERLAALMRAAVRGR